MAEVVLGLFTEQNDAKAAIDILKNRGYDPKDLSIVMRDGRGKAISRDTGVSIAEGAVSGATAGAVLGGLAGLLASTVIPGLGALFVGGPIATALGLTGAAATTVSGAATGVLAGGLIGALTGFGLSREEAQMYESRIKEGAILLAVPARFGEEAQVRHILMDVNATDVKTVVAPERAEELETEAQQAYNSYQQPRYAYGLKGGRSRRGMRRKSM